MENSHDEVPDFNGLIYLSSETLFIKDRTYISPKFDYFISYIYIWEEKIKYQGVKKFTLLTSWIVYTMQLNIWKHVKYLLMYLQSYIEVPPKLRIGAS